VLGKDYRRVAPRDNEPSLFADEEGPDLTPPGEGFELYRHKDADKMRTKGWHGYYWARRTKQGDYEIRSVPSTLGEHPVPGGVFPKESFEQLYEKMDPQDAAADAVTD
jgi:hypothetical protein